MFSFIKRNKETSEKPNSSSDLPETPDQNNPEQDSSYDLTIAGMFDGLKQRLSKTRKQLSDANSLFQTLEDEMLVVDAGTGQNALNLAEQFNKTVGLSGITISKLDGIAKGGIIFAIVKKLNIPIRFIGVGEGIDDLRPFNAKEFVSALKSGWLLTG